MIGDRSRRKVVRRTNHHVSGGGDTCRALCRRLLFYERLAHAAEADLGGDARRHRIAQRGKGKPRRPEVPEAMKETVGTVPPPPLVNEPGRKARESDHAVGVIPFEARRNQEEGAQRAPDVRGH